MSHRDALPVPDGLYAVPDPSDPGQLTYWAVRAGVARDYPPGTRHRPLPPPVDAADRADRVRQRSDWYASVYHPWRDAVDAAIVADPDGAAERFRVRYPDAELPPAPGRRRRVRDPRPRSDRSVSRAQARRRAVEALAAGELHRAGMSVRRIAAVLDLSLAATWRRLQDAGAVPAYVTPVERAAQLPQEFVGYWPRVDLPDGPPVVET